eukprot:326343_1
MTLLCRWICYFIIIIECVVGIEYVCDSNNPCSHQNITCQAEACILQCIDARSCMNLTFTCNSIKLCHVNCQQDESCKDIQLYAIGEGINIYCSATSSCEGAYINTTSIIPGGHIILECISEQDATRECANLFMDANGQGDVTITCGSVQSTNPQHAACLNTTINCNMQQGECRLSCDYAEINDNDFPCMDSKLYCAETAICRDIQDPYNEWNIVTHTPTLMPTIEPRYVLENQHVGYYQAEENCASQYGGYLATIITQQDLTFANELTKGDAVWIGLRKIDGFGWSWTGGTTCKDNLCENNAYWNNESVVDTRFSYGYLENGKFIASDGVSSRSYLCNILPMTDYVCVDYYNEFSFIMRYNYFYKYAITTNTNDTYQLQWNNADYTWNFITDNGTQGYCNSNKFILPYRCNEWNGDNMSNIKFTSCPFHSICVVGLHNKTNDITRFDFQYWDYEHNGAVYRNLTSTDNLEIFRNNNGTHNEFIIGRVFEGRDLDIKPKAIAKCNILTLPSKPSHIISCNQWYFMNNLLDITISFCPTDNPTFGPTANPIAHPTINPTAKTTEFYFISTTLSTKNITNVIKSTIITTDEISIDTYEDKYEAHESFNSNINHNFQYALISVIIIFSILIVIGYIHSRCISINHFFYVGALFHIAVNFMDLLSDVFFVGQAWVLINFNKPQTQIIFYASCFFIVIPIAFSYYQLYHEMHKHWFQRDILRAWLAKRSTLLFIMAIITGSSFASIDLFNSNLFSLDAFDMGLSREEYISFRYKRVYSLVLLENFPQLILQIWYIAATNGYYNIITITSLTFTVISIIVSIISMCVTKQILYDQESIMIEYDVTGQVIVLNRKNANRTWKLNQQLAIILGQNKNIIDIERPHTIPGGVQVHLNIHIIDNTGHQKDNLEQIMQKAISNGQIAETMKNSWNLRGVPMISNLNCWTKSSKRKTKGFSANILSNVIDNDQVMQSVQMVDAKQSDNNIDEKQNEGQKIIEKQQSIVIEGHNTTNDEVKEDERKTLLKGDYDDEDVDNINVNVIGYNNEQRIVNEIDDITNRLTKNADGAISQFDTAGFVE